GDVAAVADEDRVLGRVNHGHAAAQIKAVHALDGDQIAARGVALGARLGAAQGGQGRPAAVAAALDGALAHDADVADAAVGGGVRVDQAHVVPVRVVGETAAGEGIVGDRVAALQRAVDLQGHVALQED